MLVLTRKEQQSVVLTIDGHEILVKCLSCEQGRMRLGIQAPPEVKVMREEIVNKPRRTA